MYKLLNYLFGWDYIAWDNSVARGVARVFTTPDGNVCYWRYKSIKVIDIINKPNEVIWLTCPPSKYFGNKNGNA